MTNNPKVHDLLIVDDSPKNIQVLGTMLQPAGYRIRVACNGKEAVEMVQKSAPDLILLDIMMPIMDGLEACRILKRSDQTRHIPIIFLTAKTETADLIEAFEVGAADYVTKPFNGAELLKRIQTHLTLKDQQDRILKANTNQQQLIHVLCHDLANPLNAIASCLDLSPNHEYGELMKNAVDSSLGIIQMVRKIRSIDENKLKLKIEPLNLNALFQESAEVLQDRFSQKQVKILVDVPNTITVHVEKYSFLNSVLNNLLTNAIKFSYPNSQVRVAANEQKGQVIITVEDFGIGIPPRLKNNLFNVAECTNRCGTEGETGTGFGMPLVKRFLDEFNGTIEVTSKCQREFPNDHGTTVTIRLKSPNNMLK